MASRDKPTKRLAADWKTANVFLDTSVYMSSNFAYRSVVLRSIRRLARRGLIKVFTTTVVESEVRANIGDEAKAADNALRSLRDRGRILRNLRSDFGVLFAPFDVGDIEGRLNRQYSDFARGTKISRRGYRSRQTK